MNSKVPEYYQQGVRLTDEAFLGLGEAAPGDYPLLPYCRDCSVRGASRPPPLFGHRTTAASTKIWRQEAVTFG